MIQFSDYLSSNLWQLVIVAVVGFLCGSVNFSLLITRLSGKADIRTMGSGNAGFTNMLRSVGKKQATITFIGDFFKAALPIAVIWILLHYTIGNKEYVSLAKYICGLFCVLGHMYPLYYGFRGGKGVVTSAAVLLMVDYRVFLIAVAVFFAVFFISKLVSLGSICAAATFFLATFFINFFILYKLGNCSLIYLIITCVISFVISSLVIIRHRSNIGRIIRGEEKKVVPHK